jgi:hypothetical protein
MVYEVEITESYTYSQRIKCADEEELSRILHEECPLLVDRTQKEIEKIRQDGLHLKCDYEW